MNAGPGAETHRRWLLYPQTNRRFPYQLLLEHEPGRFLSYQVQDKWPGPGKSIFCIAGPELTEEQLPVEPEPADACAIKSISRYGRKLTVILGRKVRKRSWFLTVERKSKRDPAKTYRQTFWITQSSAMARRGGTYLSGLGRAQDLFIVRDKRERYGYSFPTHNVEQAVLPSGDYALKLTSGEVIAGVERKTRDQFLHEIATFEVLKAHLVEMTASYKYKALVIEANYSDLVNPKKSRFYSAGLVAQVIAELYASFPGLQIAFCSNRKHAAEWVGRYFQRIAKLEALSRPAQSDYQLDLEGDVRES
jgi:hypothetical protein